METKDQQQPKPLLTRRNIVRLILYTLISYLFTQWALQPSEPDPFNIKRDAEIEYEIAKEYWKYLDRKYK